MAFVIDASTALAAVLPDETSPFAEAAVVAALADELRVPTLWLYEVQNGLSMAIKRDRIDVAEANAALESLRSLRAMAVAPGGLGQEFRLAQAHGLTAYDAAYLWVALSAGATLATNDGRLRRAAQTLGIALFVHGD